MGFFIDFRRVLGGFWEGSGTVCGEFYKVLEMDLQNFEAFSKRLEGQTIIRATMDTSIEKT